MNQQIQKIITELKENISNKYKLHEMRLLVQFKRVLCMAGLG